MTWKARVGNDRLYKNTWVNFSFLNRNVGIKLLLFYSLEIQFSVFKDTFHEISKTPLFFKLLSMFESFLGTGENCFVFVTSSVS